MSVGSWQPDLYGAPLDSALLDRLIEAADTLERQALGLAPQEVAAFASCMRREAAEWQALVRERPDADLVALVRVLTVAEQKLPNWEAGNRSPVIALAAELRRRGTYPPSLTAWIKANSTNKFLPWGSLLDRL